MLALLALPSKNAPSIATSSRPTRSSSRSTITKSRFACFSAPTLSLRNWPIVR